MELAACLPAALRVPGTTITPMAAGQSGAGVYRVDAGGEAFVLKIAADTTPRDAWTRALAIQQAASDAGLAPRIHHVDDARRAVLSAFVVDRRFTAGYAANRDAAIARLGELVRRVQAVPLPAGAPPTDPHAFAARMWRGFAGFVVPAWATDVIERVLAEVPPPSERPLVLAHNDMNPTNLVDDGERLVLLDWDTAGPNDAYYDLAGLAVFLVMDDATCAKLLTAYDGAAPAALPARFVHLRRFVATLCGTIFLHLARTSGHAGATGEDTIDASLSLAGVYERLRAGTLDPSTADGRWRLGLALVKAATTL